MMRAPEFSVESVDPGVRRWVILGALGPLLMGLLAQSASSAYTEKELVRGALEVQAQTLATFSSNLAAAPMDFDDDQALSEMLRSVGNVQGLEYALVRRAKGDVAAYWGDEARRIERANRFSGQGEAGTLIRTAAVKTDTKVLGEVTIAMSTRTAEAEFRKHLAQSALMAAVATLIAVVVVLRLMADIRRRSERIERDQALLRQTGTLAKVGGWELLLPDGDFRLSDEALSIFGHQCDPRELLQRIAIEKRVLATCIDVGTPFDIEIEFRDSSHRSLWLRVQGRPERAQGITKRVHGALQDITEQRAAREAALAASEAKSQFLANTSHEMRTPLNGILGMTGLALESDPPAELRAYLEAVKVSGQTMLATVNDLLDLSRIESGRLELEEVSFHLEALVVEAARSLSSQALAKGLELIVRINPGVGLQRRGDPLRLSQVVNNLVGNAIKFTEHGEVEIVLSAGEHPSQLVLSVRDTGIGIPKDRQEAIFEAFTQSDGSTSRRFGGSGLGLTITRQLVRLMGGEVSVAASSASGSTLRAILDIPVMPSEVLPESRRQNQVLIVEPNPRAAEAAVLLLSRLGLEARSVAGPSAWDVGDGFSPTYVLVDLSLVGDVKASFPQAQVVALKPFAMQWTTGDDVKLLLKPLLGREILSCLGPSEMAGEKGRARSGAPSRRLRVLLAEDNAINATLARKLIEKAGHEVTHARNGLVVLEQLAHSTFDLILMDVQMPELDGLETTRRIRREEANTGGHRTIVAMTANAMKSDELNCIAAGMDRFLSKPIEFAQLRELLEQLAQSPREQPRYDPAV